MLKNPDHYVVGGLTAAFVVSIIVLIGTIVHQEISLKARFDKIEYNQRLIIGEVDQYIPAVKQMIEDDKMLLLRMEEIKLLWRQHVEATGPK